MRTSAQWCRAAVALCAGGGVLALAGCGQYPQSTFAPAGAVAKVQLQLFDLGLWIAVPIFVIVAGLLTYILVRFHRRPDSDGMPAQVEGNRKLEIGWTLAFILLLVVLAVPNLHDQFFVGDPPADAQSAIQVTVTGHQFWWQVDYPGLHVTTANELRIPVGRTVELSLKSADVIHAFWVPRLAGKTDVIPGRTNHMWIEASKAGTYRGQCAQFCGTGHADMRFVVFAETPAQFQQWIAQMQHPVNTAQTALAKQGQTLFLHTEPCAACHTIAGTSAQGAIGPNLTDIGSRALVAAYLPNTAQNLARWLADPPAVKPGEGGTDPMPDLHLAPSQIHALVAFLESLKR